MNAHDLAPEASAETFQEGVVPVQAFTSPAIPVLPGTPLEPRRGRPATGRPDSKQQEAVRAGGGATIGAIIDAPLGVALGATKPAN